jgi:transcription initiation factor IIE alpha subunit
MELDALAKDAVTEHGSLSRRRVLKYMEDHPDEVFSQHDNTLANRLGYHPNTVGVAIWELYRRGLIERERARKKYYYGTHAAVEALRRRLDPLSESKTKRQRALERIDEIRESIRAREGRIDTRELLEVSRRAERL